LRLTVERLSIALARLPEAFEGVTVALAGDLHARPGAHGSAAAAAMVSALNALEPDLIILLGDLVHHPMTASACLTLPSGLTAKHGVWACLGNHEHAFIWYSRWLGEGRQPSLDQWRRIYAAAGIRLLANEARPIQRDGGRLWLLGIDDPYSRHDDLAAALSEAPTQECLIAFAHSPDLADHRMIGEVDLLLAAHTHGGQIRVPGIGALYAPCRNPRRRAAGLLSGERTTVYVNRGVGEAFPLRLCCPREITLITLRRPAP
jgi:hypothetical protein